jgi:hypothetical protein
MFFDKFKLYYGDKSKAVLSLGACGLHKYIISDGIINLNERQIKLGVYKYKSSNRHVVFVQLEISDCGARCVCL